MGLSSTSGTKAFASQQKGQITGKDNGSLAPDEHKCSQGWGKNRVKFHCLCKCLPIQLPDGEGQSRRAIHTLGRRRTAASIQASPRFQGLRAIFPPRGESVKEKNPEREKRLKNERGDVVTLWLDRLQDTCQGFSSPAVYGKDLDGCQTFQLAQNNLHSPE
ncbi:unnamed protein product [Eretmochelys imbricata]